MLIKILFFSTLLYLISFAVNMELYSNDTGCASDVFDKLTVKRDVKKYLGIVFGARKARLSDYYYFEGRHSDLEVEIESQVCEKKYGGVNSNECNKWILARHKHPAKNISLYYQFLKEKLNIDPSTIIIQKISYSKSVKGKCPPYEIIVQGRSYDGNKLYSLLIEHGQIRYTEEQGLVSLVSIDNMFVWDLIERTE